MSKRKKPDFWLLRECARPLRRIYVKRLRPTQVESVDGVIIPQSREEERRIDDLVHGDKIDRAVMAYRMPHSAPHKPAAPAKPKRQRFWTQITREGTVVRTPVLEPTGGRGYYLRGGRRYESVADADFSTAWGRGKSAETRIAPTQILDLQLDFTDRNARREEKL